jgi:hypothetical protein
VNAAAPVGRLVPVVDEPEPATQAEDRSWDAFWAEVQGSKTTTIRGVEVRVPTGMTLGASREMAAREDGHGVATWAPIATELFRAPDGTVIPDLWPRWTAAGMDLPELEVVMTWGLAHSHGNPITFAEAYQDRQDAKAGKAQPAERKPSSAATGGRSKQASQRTASSRKTSRA